MRSHFVFLDYSPSLLTTWLTTFSSCKDIDLRVPLGWLQTTFFAAEAGLGAGRATAVFVACVPDL